MKNKHKISTWGIVIIMFILIIGVFAGALTSEDLDEVCSEENSFLYKFNNITGWGCGQIDSTDFNITINNNNVTLVEIEPQGSNGMIQYNDAGRLNGTSNLYWDKTNENLGLGISNPEVDFHVNGIIQTAGSSGTTDRLRFAHNTYAIPSIWALTNAGGIQDIALNPAGGNVGIGTTTPTKTLQVATTSTSSQTLAHFGNVVNSGSEQSIQIGYTPDSAANAIKLGHKFISGSSTDTGFLELTSGTRALEFDYQGDVTIGKDLNVTNNAYIHELIICDTGTATIMTRNQTLAASMGC